MKKLIAILLTSFVLLLIVFIINLNNTSIILKWLVGTARYIGRPINSRIFINNSENKNAKLYYVNSDYYNKNVENYYVLYLRNVNNTDYPVYIINRKYNLVAIPNASESDYDVYFGNLFQSDSGANVQIPVDDTIKGFGYNPKLTISKNIIEFYDENNLKYKILIK